MSELGMKNIENCNDVCRTAIQYLDAPTAASVFFLPQNLIYQTFTSYLSRAHFLVPRLGQSFPM